MCIPKRIINTAVIALTFIFFSADADELKKDLIVDSASAPIKDLTPLSRVALVIGNADYKAGRLKNPVNDALDMEQVLKSLGFKVILGTDQTRQQMWNAIRDFGDQIGKHTIGLFYYSGHGIKIGENNYLLPIGADIEREDEVSFQAIPADLVLNKMKSAGNPLNIVILDACRNNPFEKSWSRSVNTGQGLAKMDSMIPPNGLLIFYAAKPGTVALDGEDRNSPFTKSLKKNIMEPGLDIRILPSIVATDVIRETNDKQHPWLEGMILDKFSFHSPGAAPKMQLADSSGVIIETPRKPPEKMTLTVSCNTDSASVWINGENYGKVTDFSFTDPGNYRVKITADGYQPYQTVVKMTAGKSEEVKVFLEKAEDLVSPATVSGHPKQFKNAFGMTFVYIEPGTFMMGSPEHEPGREEDETLHQVTLTKGFYMQTTEVTQGQWKAAAGNIFSELYFKNCGDGCPVERVSWIDIRDFIALLNEKENTDSYRLPTEAEWEYAARAGTSTPFSFGDCLSADEANFDGSAPFNECPTGRFRKKALPAESFPPNAWGLYDMHGNVGEWCQDLKGDYSSEPATDPTGFSTCLLRVIRGGSWGTGAKTCRSAVRFASLPDYRGNIVGFRLAKTP